MSNHHHVRVRKARAGTDSAGHHWPTDGAVIEVDPDHALVLARIPDGGFAIVETAEPAENAEPAQQVEPDEPAEPAEPVEPVEKTPKPAAARAARAKAEPAA